MVFDKTYLKARLGQLPADKIPAWGSMTPQHMTEHLRLAVQLSDSRATFPLVTPEEKVERARNRMLSDEWQMPVNFKAAFMPEEGLRPLEFDSLPAAIDALMAEIDYFYDFFEKNPDAKPVHPYFGPLNRQEWEINHHKHFSHHLQQFGLL